MMKTLTLTLSKNDTRALIILLSKINFTDIARKYTLDPVAILTIWTPLEKLMSKLRNYPQRITLDVSMAAAFFMVTNSMAIEGYVSILHILQKVENFLVNIYSQLEKSLC